MDFARIATITIAHLDFLDLTSRTTKNPLAETEVPEMLRQAIKAGVKVLITDVDGTLSCRLTLSDQGEFQYQRLP